MQARAGSGSSRRAFSELVTRHSPWLLGLLTRLLGSRSDAEDVAQETFVRAYLALDRFDVHEPLPPWLRVIATRLAYNRIRSSSTRTRYGDAFQAMREATAQPRADPVATRDSLHKALAQLSYPFREVLVLHHLEGLSVKEIAATLGIGLSAAKMRLKRARAQFVQIYNQADRDDPAR